MPSIGRRLRQKRLERNVTQAQVADALGVSQAMLSQLEAGKLPPGDELDGKIRRWLASGGVPGKAKRGAYKA
jgi:transcriptional regulator with XRE-family HTH domain